MPLLVWLVKRATSSKPGSVSPSLQWLATAQNTQEPTFVFVVLLVTWSAPKAIFADSFLPLKTASAIPTLSALPVTPVLIFRKTTFGTTLSSLWQKIQPDLFPSMLTWLRNANWTTSVAAFRLKTAKNWIASTSVRFALQATTWAKGIAWKIPLKSYLIAQSICSLISASNAAMDSSELALPVAYLYNLYFNVSCMMVQAHLRFAQSALNFTI